MTARDTRLARRCIRRGKVGVLARFYAWTRGETWEMRLGALVIRRGR